MSLFALVLVAILIFCYLWRRRHLYAFARQLDGPPALPLIGNGLMFIGSPERSFYSMQKIIEQCRSKGASLGRIWIGPKLWITVADPTQISLLLNNNLQKGQEYKLFDEVLHKGILVNSNIPQWRTSRKMITPVFHFNILKSYIRIFHSEASILAGKWRHLADSGASFNPEEDINLATFDMVMMSTLGISPRAQDMLDHPFLYHVDRAFEIAFMRFFNPLLQTNWMCRILGIRARQKAHIKVLIDIAQDTLDQIRQKQKRNKDGKRNGNVQREDEEKRIDVIGGVQEEIPTLSSADSLQAAPPYYTESIMEPQSHDVSTIDLLEPEAPSFAELMMQHASYDPSDDEELISEIITIIGAGQDTTKTVNMAVLLMLALHQDVQDKVLEEIDRVLGNSSQCPSYEDLGRLEYLEWVIKETMRLYPSVPMISRYIDRDFPLGDVTLPAGVTAVVSIYALHRDPSFYTQPHRFDPGRWHPEEVRQRPPSCFIPFSTGPRNCIGARYAMFQMRATLSTLLRRYRILPGEGCDRMKHVKFTIQVTMKMSETCRIRLQRRDN